MPKDNRPEMPPYNCVDHYRRKYHIEVELPGVNKENIKLEVGEQSFCVRAPSKDLIYNACYTLAHPVNTNRSNASFNNGLLVVNIPLKAQIAGLRSGPLVEWGPKVKTPMSTKSVGRFLLKQ